MSLGAFQSFYERGYLKGSSPSDISWIGTVQSSFILLGSVYAGPLYDWGYMNLLIRVGSFMVVFGMFMTSLCTQYWQILLAQGFFMGLGTGCLFTPTLGIVASYFGKKRGLAMGMASAGSTIGKVIEHCFVGHILTDTGGIIYPIMFQKLTGPAGFGWAVRAIAFVILSLSVLPIAGMKMRLKPPAARRVFDAAVWKEPNFSLFAIAFFCGYIGLYIPFFYIQIYCLEKGIIDGELNSYILPIMNSAGFFGRMVNAHCLPTCMDYLTYSSCRRLVILAIALGHSTLLSSPAAPVGLWSSDGWVWNRKAAFLHFLCCTGFLVLG